MGITINGKSTTFNIGITTSRKYFVFFIFIAGHTIIIRIICIKTNIINCTTNTETGEKPKYKKISAIGKISNDAPPSNI